MIRFDDYKRLLMSMARRVQRRCHAAGAKSVQFEDIFQEMCVAYVFATHRYNSELGVPFGAFLVRGVSLHINRWVQREIGQKLLAPFDLDFTADKDEDGGSLQEVIADPNAEDPEDRVIEEDCWNRAMALASPRTRQFLQILRDPPPKVVDMVRAFKFRRQFAKTRNAAVAPAPKDVTASIVFELMGCAHPERTKIYAEIRALSAEISQ